MYQKVIDHIHPQISLRQFGFLSNRSTVHKLLSTLSFIVHSMDSKCATDVIYLDLRKAFDSVIMSYYLSSGPLVEQVNCGNGSSVISPIGSIVFTLIISLPLIYL